MAKKPEILPSSVDSKQPAWPWPYCHHRPRTLSFRIPDDIFKTINSAYILDNASVASSSSSSSFPSSSPPPLAAADVSVESIIRSARSDRLFFEPDARSSFILDNPPQASSSHAPLHRTAPKQPDGDHDGDVRGMVTTPSPYSESVFLSVDSQDPLLDFRKSMEEMVVAHGLKDWDCLEELLCWYLKVNDEANYSYIYGAFVDLLVSQAFSESAEATSCKCSADSLQTVPPCARHYSPSSPLSFYTSSSSTTSASSSSLSARCVDSGLEVEEYEKEQCSATSSNSSVMS